MRFRKKPMEVSAEQYTELGTPVKGMCANAHCLRSAPHVHTIHDNQSVMLALNDWVLPEPDGVHFYPVKPDIFAKTYEAIEERDPTEIKDGRIRSRICTLMSEMLDNPDDVGIFPTSVFMAKMEDFVLSEIEAAKKEAKDQQNRDG